MEFPSTNDREGIDAAPIWAFLVATGIGIGWPFLQMFVPYTCTGSGGPNRVLCHGLSFSNFIHAGYSLTWIIWLTFSTTELIMLIWSFMSVKGLIYYAQFLI